MSQSSLYVSQGSMATATTPSVQSYTFDLRSGLREAARVGLSQLEATINDLGYGWLDGYMESIMERESRAPIMELMKTPSRTQTVKKTRAVATAQNDRTEKVKGLNARLNGSPVGKASPNRQLFSPLQPRSLNAVPMQIMSPSPLKTKSSTPIKKTSGDKGKKEKKKAKAKKVDENAPAASGQSSSEAGSSQRKAQSPGRIEKRSLQVDEVTPRKPASKSKQTSTALAIPLPEMQSPARVPTPKRMARSPHVNISAPMVSEDVHPTEQENQDKEIEAAEIRTRQPEGEADKEDDNVDTTVTAEAVHSPKSNAHSGPSRTVPSSPASHPRPRSQAGPSQTETAAVVPVHKVRSSWLSKALGTGTVPISGMPNSRMSTDAMAMRKSLAAPARVNPAMDFGTMRKSLVPIGGLSGTKRPSEGDEADNRPGKVLKIDLHAQLPARNEILNRSTISAPMSHTPGPTIAPVSHTPASIPSAQPESTVQSAQSRGDRGRSDIHRVTKALDELRERAAAKEAAKAKAALASSNGPRQTASSELRHSTAGGTGFFKGLSSLGRSLGLGGTAKSAEEEALRLQQELEEERREEIEAQAKLDQLIADVDRPITPAITEDGHEALVDDYMNFDPKEMISSTPFALRTQESKRDMDVDEKAEEEEEEVAEELDELMDDVQESAMAVQPVAERPDIPPVSVAAPSTTPPLLTLSRTPPKKVKDLFTATTTPTATPPRYRPTFVVEAPPLQARNEKHERPEGVRPAAKSGTQPNQPEVKAKGAEKAEPQVRALPEEVQPPAQAASKAQQLRGSEQIVVDEDEDEQLDLPDLPEPEADDERTDTEEEEEDDEEEVKEMPAKKMFKSDTDVLSTSVRTKISSTSSYSNLNASTSSQGMFGHASVIAGKTLGFKPTTGPVKSLQLAAAAAKKDQAAIDRKAHLREQAEARRAEAARKKAEEEKIKMEEDRKARAAELEEKKKLRMEAERRRKEREEKIAMVAREKAAKEEAEKAAAKAKAEEEANKKRKLAQSALNKSTNGAPKKIAQSAAATVPIVKPKEALRTIKPTITLVSSTTTNTGNTGGPKMGPTSFRTVESQSQSQHVTSSSTISLVQPQQQPLRQLGQPSRPSQQPAHNQNHAYQPSNQGRASNVLQQSRAALQIQLDEKALEVQSEDIVLPDIASEYSDSDDSDKETDFKRPHWAESPELRQALADQASRNPDELFGPIKPLNMEELFKQRTNKFRARTSSANWNGGDRLTRAEEIEYAKRMGFKPMPSGLGL